MASAFGLQTQAFLAVEGSHAFGIDLLTFSLEQYVNPAVSVADSCRRDLFDALDQHLVHRVALDLVLQGRSIESQRDTDAR